MPIHQITITMNNGIINGNLLLTNEVYGEHQADLENGFRKAKFSLTINQTKFQVHRMQMLTSFPYTNGMRQIFFKGTIEDVIEEPE